MSHRTPGDRPDPVVVATNAVFNFVDYENQCILANAKGDNLSPLVAQKVIWFLDRWASAYLMPNESMYTLISTRLWRVYGEGQQSAIDTLQRIVYKSALNLLRWSEEWDLAEASCQLIHSVVRNKKVIAHLGRIAAWNDVLTAYKQPNSPFYRLRGKVLRRFVAAMGQAAVSSVRGGASPNRKMREQARAAKQQAFAPIVQPIEQRIGHIVSQASSKQWVASTDGSNFVLTTIEMLRGVALCSANGAFDLAFTFASRHFGTLAKIIALFPEQPAVATGVMKMFRDIAQQQVVHMDDTQFAQFIRTSAALVQAFGQYHQGRLQKLNSTPSSLQDAAEEDTFADILSLLQMLNAICLVLPYDEPKLLPRAQSAAQLALAGMSMLLPFLIRNVLQFPPICVEFFSLLRDVVEHHPSSFARINADARKPLMKTIEFAIGHDVIEVVRAGLSALRCIGMFHANALIHQREVQQQKQRNLPVQRQAYDTPFEQDVQYFMRLLLSMLVMQKIDPNCLSAMADALFPLIVSSPAAFKTLVNEVVANCQQDANKQQRLVTGFNALMSSNGLSSSFTRANRSVFQRNVRNFVVLVRSFVQLK
eukprot:TRINITY_DN41653_c0_g1_i1.p1 TRINITY_DN41653_c0_g1~~TRINITY_DN41653_c0_g1_i1.p1  ORF type:complete len:642 (+),score=311.05 TRINITY_DN41653_c0_g1_i1:153-1928(+)